MQDKVQKHLTWEDLSGIRLKLHRNEAVSNEEITSLVDAVGHLWYKLNATHGELEAAREKLKITEEQVWSEQERADKFVHEAFRYCKRCEALEKKYDDAAQEIERLKAEREQLICILPSEMAAID